MEYTYKHYIRTDERDRIIHGFSDVFESPKADDICINQQGGYQFRLFPEGEENPPLFEWEHMIPLYKWESGQVTVRTESEIQADIDALPEPDTDPVSPDSVSVWDELDAAYQEGVDSI